MNTKKEDYPQSVINTACPYCGEKTPINRPNDYRSRYAYCLPCKEKFVVEPIRDGVKVFTLMEVPYNIDPECQALERGQSDEE
ncbi:MAG: hypothetical protein KKF12_09320 [Proteobacteria bacterium]|nr:hypothetical protein [Desulfobacula sp.]MBU3950928.1 hypothetical protein [Pseudomonadota bacterium]MBU4131005.1 hypothetical protein [Pseudomonadota bacterium]